jgi:hypothetical protein
MPRTTLELRAVPARLLLSLGLLVAGATAPAAARQLATPAPSATEIRPLLLGAEVPAAPVRGLDGEATDLRSVVLGKPTLLLFYRGGW